MVRRLLLPLVCGCASALTVPSALSLAMANRGGRKPFGCGHFLQSPQHIRKHTPTIRESGCRETSTTALSFATTPSAQWENEMSGEGGGSGDDDAERTTTKVIVVGAGISGLSVAYNLWKLAQSLSSEHLGPRRRILDVEILEVRNRIGGRVEPFRIQKGQDRNPKNAGEDVWIDLGGQWVHEAAPENPIRKLLHDDLQHRQVDFVPTQTPKLNHFHARRKKNVLFRPDGKSMDKAMVQIAKTIFYKAMDDLDDENDDSNAMENPRRTSISFRDLVDARIQDELAADHRLRKASSHDLVSLDMAMNYFVHRSEGYEGGRLHEVSALLADTLYTGHGGPDRVVKGSYKSLLNALSSEMGLYEDRDSSEDSPTTKEEDNEYCKVRLRQNARVTRIEYESNGNNISKESGNERISLSVVENEEVQPVPGESSGASPLITPSVMECDYCVCTVPLGVLQQRKIDFVPPLPQKRQEAIDGIGMGLLNKIVFRFDFEHSNSSDNESDSSTNQDETNGNSFKFWGNLKQFGICHEDPAFVKTYYDCTDDYYENNTNPGKSAILVQFLAGSVADRIDPPLPSTADDNDGNTHKNQGLTDEEAIRESLEALRSVFGSENVPDPAVAKVTRWREDPWSCGSYSFAKVGSSASMYDEIASPLRPNGRLLFAGEHTSKHFHSTVHGAWETGEREAKRIFDTIR